MRGRLALTVGCLLIATGAFAQSPAELKAQADELTATNQYARAIETYGLIPDTAPPKLRLDRHTGVALAMVNLGRFAGVPHELDRAALLAEEIGGPEALARVEHVRGFYQNRARRADLGFASMLRGAQLAEQAGNRQMLGSIYGNLASAYQSLEDWERQAYYAQKGFELLDQPTTTNRFNHLMEVGIAQFELFERDAAEARYLEALEIAKQMGAKRNQSWALGELAYSYWTFDRNQEKALEHYNAALALAEEAKVPDLLKTWFVNRGNVFRDTGRYEQALADYRRALSLDAGAGFTQRKNIGQVHRLMGKTAEAAAELEDLLATRGDTASPRLLWQARMELASAYDTLGRRDQADAAFKAMMTTLEEQRNTAILSAFRTGSFAHALSAYDPYDRYIRFLVSGSSPRAADALEIVERARARGFLESLASVRAAVAARLPAPLLEKETEIRRAITAAQEQLRAADLPRADRERLLGDLKRAEQRRDDFVLAMRVENPSLAEARYPALAETSELQRQMRPGETALVFFLSEPASFRWVVSRDRIDVARMAGRAEIEKRAAALRTLLRAPSDLANLRAHTAAMSALLFDGLRIDDDGPVTIVPHGVLHYVPFEAVPLDGRLLIERHPVSYAPSLNALAYLRRLAVDAAPFRVLAVGNPAVASGRAAAVRGGDVDNLALLGPLPFAARELHAIRHTFWARTDVLSGAAATESALRRESLDRFPVVHFATHGLVNDQHPKRSGLLLSPEKGDDGLLQMGEIYGLGLRANLVVLSACQTALGREVTGEGIVGLSRAFFYAGARSVVSALWNLNDRFTAEFIERFYQEIGAGRAPEEALRQTKLAYINHAEFGHPFYWSSLVLTGDGTPTLVTGPLGQPIWPTVLAVLMTLAAAFLWLRSVGENPRTS